MLRILCEVTLDEASLRSLEGLPGVHLQRLPAHSGEWDLPARLLPGAEVLLCKLPPRNLDALAGLKLIQISTVGYEHLSHFHFEDRAVKVCNARGVFDTAIAEWSLAMMIALVRDLRGMVRNQEHG